MNVEYASDDLLWYAICTKPGQEDRAGTNLANMGVEIFTPRFKKRRTCQFTGTLTEVIKPLFPRYIFARFNCGALIHKVRYTRGVHSVVSFGDHPTPVEKEVINIIRSKIGTDGFVRIGETLKSGDEVLIKEGPMKGLVGIFERDVKDSERVLILLNISYQAHIEIKREAIKKIYNVISPLQARAVGA